MRCLIAILLFLRSGNALAHDPEEGDTYATIGPTVHRTVTSPRDKSSVPAMFGAGLTVEGDLGRSGGVEIGLYYLNKHYLVKRDDLALVERIRRAVITTGYRHWVQPRIAFGLALASAYTMGDPVVLHNEISDENVRTSARDTVEYLLDVSVLAELWTEGRWSVVTDFRYSFSFAEVQGQRSDTWSAMLGAKYLIPKSRLGGG